MILYKKDTKNKLRILDIKTDWDLLIQISWLLDWKKVEHIKKALPKNIGKSNQTSWEIQAKVEKDALIKKKLQEWYFQTIEEVYQKEVIMPMLAKNYIDEKSKIDWGNCYVQPKLDWMRCLAFCSWKNIRLMSRKGIEIITMPHIIKDLQELNLKDKVLDWELYLHWESFQENMKLIKKYRKWETEKIKYCIYDIVEDKPFIERYKDIELLSSKNINIVQTIQIKTEEELKKHHTQNIELLYEGSIIRYWDNWYKVNWRSDNLLKYKDFIDDIFEVVDIIPMEVYTNQGLVVLKNKDWNIFKATPKLSFEDKKILLIKKEDYIWQNAEIRFFEYSEEWIPRFPICVWFRLDK
jgi:ATP-dependent DNA ligase